MRTQATLPWNGPSTSSAALQKIKSNPIHARQRLVQHRAQVGRIGEAMAFAGIQCRQLLIDLLIGSRFGKIGIGCDEVHRRGLAQIFNR